MLRFLGELINKILKSEIYLYIDHIHFRYNGSKTSNLVTYRECFTLLILNTSIILLSQAVMEISVLMGSIRAVFWTFLVVIILGGNSVYILLLPVKILLRSRYVKIVTVLHKELP